jgi:methylmalonyl-CoA carboxyltransferase 12S subunit
MAKKMPTAVEKAQVPDLAQVLAELQAQLASLSQRIERLEAAAAPVPAPAPAPVPAPAAAEKPAAPGITEEEILAVSAALAAYLGVRLRIRQIRLLGSPAWAQQGRVSIQASHQLHS